MLLLSFYGQIAIILFCSLLFCSVPAQLQQSQILRKLRPAPRERGSWRRCQVTGCKGKDQHPSHEPPCSMFSVQCSVFDVFSWLMFTAMLTAVC